MTMPLRTSSASRSPSRWRSASAATRSRSAADSWPRSAPAWPRCGRARKPRSSPRRRWRAITSPPPPLSLDGCGDRGRARGGAAGRGLEIHCRVRAGLRGADRRPHRARRPRGGARRRRHRRSRRLRRGRGAPRARLCAGADHAARPGRLLGRRQDRDQFPPWQEPDRRLPPAGAGGRRHRAARHAAAARSSVPAMPKSRNTGCSAMPPSSPGSKRTGRTCLPADRRASMRLR